MRVRLTIDGVSDEVEVDVAVGSVTVRGRSVTVKRLASTASGEELEIAGERVLVEGWPEERRSAPPNPTVNGERFALSGVSRSAGAGVAFPPAPSGPVPVPVPPSTEAPGNSTIIVPPMPGKVIEVRVSRGEKVAAGQVLVVLEAMKMRNEVSSPVAGVVDDVKVSAGENVRAHQPMVVIGPMG